MKVDGRMSHKVLLVDVADVPDDTFKETFQESGYDVAGNLRSLTVIESHLKLDKHIQCVVVNMTAPSDAP